VLLRKSIDYEYVI